ncbi:TIGR00701 family protein [Ahniella affigens]|uniref:Protoporphyrinogen IX oxidase n=1 Tax=Ahniella affigens TaxID=2021234 RepID=A0A2P1PM27_9GAMM|nr:CopD family protein [Ahniella affigens]AVP95901.1 TIGR00701 family protein [Ahniella affigens]
MAYIKAFHIIFVVAWFAGLFYLPRLFIYHQMASSEAEHARFVVMERRLLGITHIGGILALVFGLWSLFRWIQVSPDFMRQGWLHAKLTLVALLIAYHGSLMVFARQFAERRFSRSGRWLRIYNEMPALILIGVVILVVVRPF